ncbi:MAG: hypothetical protein IKN87_03475 [Bacilli bacterium]|nr:hypothetical protein [Bacilli bacterium]
MKGLFDFIANYYLWIILGLAVIFFAYMGYSAEKKGYIGNKKKKADEDLVDIDELLNSKKDTVKVEKPVEEDLSSSFDVMPTAKSEDLSSSFDVMPDVPKKEEKQEEDISEDLYAPFGDQKIEAPAPSVSVDEVEDASFNQEFVDVAKIEAEAKDIINGDEKRDIADLMKSDGTVSSDFEVEGATKEPEPDNIFEKVAAEDKKKKKKKEEVVDDMWKF